MWIFLFRTILNVLKFNNFIFHRHFRIRVKILTVVILFNFYVIIILIKTWYAIDDQEVFFFVLKSLNQKFSDLFFVQITLKYKSWNSKLKLR